MFTWDEGKRQINIAKHGVDFTAVYDFDFLNANIEVDDRFEYGEVREVSISFIGSRLHVLVFTRRGGNIHVISLRKANDREVRKYVQALK